MERTDRQTMRIAKDLQGFACEPEGIQLAEIGAGLFRKQAAARAEQGALAQIVLGQAQMVSAQGEGTQRLMFAAGEKCLYPLDKTLGVMFPDHKPAVFDPRDKAHHALPLFSGEGGNQLFFAGAAAATGGALVGAFRANSRISAESCVWIFNEIHIEHGHKPPVSFVSGGRPWDLRIFFHPVFQGLETGDGDRWRSRPNSFSGKPGKKIGAKERARCYYAHVVYPVRQRLNKDRTTG